jgi:predicted alpha/beta superfamily hydrolase
MKKLNLIFLLIFWFLLTNCQEQNNNKIVFSIEKYPDYTPPEDKIYLVGNINNWTQENPSYAFKKIDNRFELTISEPPTNIEFKLNRGDWARVEADAYGKDIPNRKISTENKDTIKLNIESWKDLVGSPYQTNQANVTIINPNFYMPQFKRTRRIWVYLPPSYHQNPTERYPVLYMHDAQNLFDPATSFVGEWGIDESLNLLIAQGNKPCIVVGIDHGGDKRISELTPYSNPKYGGGDGDLYVEFIVSTLYPYINQNFRTLSNRENTGIMGSSLGGLISFYAGIKHPEVFGKVGVFSPSFWFSDEIYTFVNIQGKKLDSKFYFLAGQKEDATLVNKVNQMKTLMLNKGFKEDEIFVSIKADGTHSEWFWRREFPNAYKWLFN